MRIPHMQKKIAGKVHDFSGKFFLFQFNQNFQKSRLLWMASIFSLSGIAPSLVMT